MFVQGREALTKGNAELACQKFHAVNRIKPDAPSVLLNLGLCYEAQNKLATALKWFQKAQLKASQQSPQTDDMRQFEEAAKEKTGILSAGVARVRIETRADVDVTLDGERLDPRDLADPVPVDAGSHRIEASAPGMKTHVQEITIADKETKDVSIPALEKAPPPPKLGPTGPSRRGRGLLLTVISAGAIVGIPFGAYAIQTSQKGSDGYSIPVHVAMGTMGAVWVAAIGGVGLGVYWMAKPYPNEGKERRVTFTPVVTPAYSGVSLGGRF